jgi:hypothetical protein
MQSKQNTRLSLAGPFAVFHFEFVDPLYLGLAKRKGSGGFKDWASLNNSLHHIVTPAILGSESPKSTGDRKLSTGSDPSMSLLQPEAFPKFAFHAPRFR